MAGPQHRPIAADRDQQFRVMDQEAQRCRAALSRGATPAPKTTTRQEEHH